MNLTRKTPHATSTPLMKAMFPATFPMIGNLFARPSLKLDELFPFICDSNFRTALLFSGSDSMLLIRCSTCSSNSLFIADLKQWSMIKVMCLGTPDNILHSFFFNFYKSFQFSCLNTIHNYIVITHFI